LCKVCNSIFDKKYKLINHNVKKHDGQMPYLCTLCGKGFIFLKLLEQHTESVHEGIRYDCTLCDSNFTREMRLKRHVKHKVT
jgi:KRAB domain-containing zinc finger protein